jgi:hypothetical protein
MMWQDEDEGANTVEAVRDRVLARAMGEAHDEARLRQDIVILLAWLDSVEGLAFGVTP